MNRLHQWQSGYELYDPTGGQRVLPLACSIENQYLQRYCGVCNRNCRVALSNRYTADQAITPSRVDLEDIVNALSGLGFSNTGQGVNVAGLAPMVSLITADPKSIPGDAPLYAVSLGGLFRLRSTTRGKRVEPRHDIRRSFRLPPDSSLVLTGNALDEVLEWISAAHELASEVIQRNRFDYVIAPNYSVYGDKCPVEWAVNLRRTNLALGALRNVTGNPVPLLATPNAHFEHRAIEWLSANPNVNCVAFNTQMMKTWTEFLAQLHAIVRLKAAVARPLHVLITGPSSKRRIQAVQELIHSATIISTFHLNGSRKGV